MTKTDQVTALAVLLLTAFCAQDQCVLAQTAQFVKEAGENGTDERTELLTAVARSAAERCSRGEVSLPPAEWTLLVHLAS